VRVWYGTWVRFSNPKVEVIGQQVCGGAHIKKNRQVSLVPSPDHWIVFETRFVRQCYADVGKVGSEAAIVSVVCRIPRYNTAYWRLGTLVRFLYFFVSIPPRTGAPDA
jgi:hypothetical protein